MVPSIHQSIQQKSWLLKASRPSYLETRLSKPKYKNTFKSVDYHVGEQRQVTRITLESKDKSNCSASSFEMRWGANFEAEFVPSFKSMIPSSSKYLYTETQFLFFWDAAWSIYHLWNWAIDINWMIISSHLSMWYQLNRTLNCDMTLSHLSMQTAPCLAA